MRSQFIVVWILEYFRSMNKSVQLKFEVVSSPKIKRTYILIEVPSNLKVSKKKRRIKKDCFD